MSRPVDRRDVDRVVRIRSIVDISDPVRTVKVIWVKGEWFTSDEPLSRRINFPARHHVPSWEVIEEDAPA